MEGGPLFWVKKNCMRGGHSSSQEEGGGLVRSLLASGTVLESTAGMFLRIQSDIYNHLYNLPVFTNYLLSFVF